jgi:hypothetical protein
MGSPAPARRRWRPVAALAVLAVAAALLLLERGSDAALGDNLVPNPTVARRDGGNPADWSRGAWGSLDARYSVAKPGEAGGGDGALQVRVTRYESGDAKWMFPAVVAVPGAQYDFRFSYKANVTSAVVAEWTMADGSHQYQGLGELPASRATWRQFDASFLAPEGAAAVTVYHLIAAVGWIRSDTFQLSQVTEGGVPPTTAAVDVAAPAGGRVAQNRSSATTAPPPPAAPTVPGPASPEAAPATTGAPATTAAPAAPTGLKCVVGMPGAGGSTDAGAGFGGGKGYDQGAGFETRTTPDLPELGNVQAAADGCGAVIIHGFSEGARRAKELYCSGETLGGRVVGYIIDDPNYFPDEGQPCRPGAGVKVALYATHMGPGDGQWTINVYLSGLGYGDVLAKTEARLGVTAKVSPNYAHIPYTNPSPPEITGSGWW